MYQFLFEFRGFMNYGNDDFNVAIALSFFERDIKLNVELSFGKAQHGAGIFTFVFSSEIK